MTLEIKSPSRGCTAIELLIVASILALVIAFSVPMVNSAKHQSKVEDALKITQDSVKQARRKARFYQTDVLLHIESGETERPNAIKLTLPKLRQDPALNDYGEEFSLPEGVDVISGDAVIRFDPNGIVDWPATVVLASDQSEDMSQLLLIE